MYIEDASEALAQSLERLAGSHTVVLLAYGRNRPAEGSFLRRIQNSFAASEVSSEELDSRYQCVDVTVLRLQKRT